MEKLIILNKKIDYEYEIKEKFVAGLVLFGDEVKSIKNSSFDMKDSYIKISSESEVLLLNFKISPYKKSNLNLLKHKPNRSIKLLLKKSEIKKLNSLLKEKSYTAIPKKIFVKNNFIKVEIAVVRGKKKYEKREFIKNKEIKKDLQKNYKLHS
ncbi:MAG TPA: SsrA-binding protein SmpB [bacterium]|jgi:SsrA-binding protein|nr:SsrA-binding protein SmpB [bacterium]HOG37948.1 SsrA-binding protein SmpB [bacterium]HQI03006.1 SsrA-binding protein SmpB [bacterium]